MKLGVAVAFYRCGENAAGTSRAKWGILRGRRGKKKKEELSDGAKIQTLFFLLLLLVLASCYFVSLPVDKGKGNVEDAKRRQGTSKSQAVAQTERKEILKWEPTW